MGHLEYWCAALLPLLACSSSPGSSGAAAVAVNPAVDMPSAHLVIADQFNNRVLEIDREGNVVWTFGDGSSVPGPHSVVGPNDVERLPDGSTLISGTGAPTGIDPACSATGGCLDNRVLLVNASGDITWQYGQDGGVAGSGPDQLDGPVAARQLSNGNVLITDQGNDRVLEVTPAKSIAWVYPAAGGGSPLQLPNSAERLASGNTLIADEGSDRVVEVDSAGNVVWQYPAGRPSPIGYVAFASRLANGNTLITDGMHNRILEVTPQLAIAWSYVTSNRPGSSGNPQPSRAVRMSNGDTLVSDQLNQQVIEVDRGGKVLWTYGKIDAAGVATGLLDAPYDAKVIGDFTGLTAPE